MDRMLEHGCVVYATLDGSPQGGYDLLMVDVARQDRPVLSCIHDVGVVVCVMIGNLVEWVAVGELRDYTPLLASSPVSCA